MKRPLINRLRIAGAALFIVIGLSSAFVYFNDADPLYPLYVKNCAGCHGIDLEESDFFLKLLESHQDQFTSYEELTETIRNGIPGSDMPSFRNSLTDNEIRGLSILISERQADIQFINFNNNNEYVLPRETIKTEIAHIQIETVVSNLSEKPFSVEALPNGDLLLAQKVAGLSTLSNSSSALNQVSGTPETASIYFKLLGLDFGVGYLHDVAAHPDYSNNGWIYLLHTHICKECRGMFDLTPSTMTRLIRGKIENGMWQQQEILWQADQRFYSSSPDIGVGGRLAFDNAGHVFFTIGIKGLNTYTAWPEVDNPFGKVHRINMDGSIPQDNPFVGNPNAINSVWTLGHRTPQGLEFDPTTNQLWESEMGPRGGDEINLLVAGGNYGWPLKSAGLHYFGSTVEKSPPSTAMQIDLDSLIDPVLDLTPAPAVSSFIVYRGQEFIEWQGDLIVGSLKAGKLYRFEIENNQAVYMEEVLSGLPRIRDIEIDHLGRILILLEETNGSRLLRVSAN